MDPITFDRERHVAFLETMLERLPEDYEAQEINRLTLAYYVVSGLAVLDALDRCTEKGSTTVLKPLSSFSHLKFIVAEAVPGVMVSTGWLFLRNNLNRWVSGFLTVGDVNKEQLISWVLSYQVHPISDADLKNGKFYGFGGAFQNFSNDDGKVSEHNFGHLASTYCAIAILKVIGYSFSNFEFTPILSSMRWLQQPDGSFIPIHVGAEADLRFVYCAAAICFMLKNWTGMNREKAREYILNCQSYDGGFGLVPGAESHGGATYCAVAALNLMGFIEMNVLSKFSQTFILDINLLLGWCLEKQSIDGGFQGRTNKPSDTCYAFWVGGVLKLLGGYQFCDRDLLRRFLLSCQSPYGGFKKLPENIYPDVYHSFYGLSALSLLEEPGLKPLRVELGIPAVI